MQSSASQVAPPDQARAKLLIAATLALVVCRLVGLRHSVAGMAAGGMVMTALAIAIVRSSPRLRRWMFGSTLPMAVVANATTLAAGSCAALLGSQGLLPGGRLGMKVAWTPLFWWVPLAAAVSLWALARASGPGFRTRRGAAVAANVLTALYAIWYWQSHEALANPQGAPPTGAVLMLAVVAISLAALFWQAPPQENGAAAPRLRALRQIAFVLVAAAPVVVTVVAFLPIYRHRQTVAELESLGYWFNAGRAPRWARKLDDFFPVYDYLAEVDFLEVRQAAEVSTDDVEQIERLLKRLPALSSLLVSNIRPDAGRLLRPLAGRRSLREVTLIGPGITDADVSALERYPGLQTLYLRGTRVTPEGVAGLVKALPRLRVVNLPPGPLMPGAVPAVPPPQAAPPVAAPAPTPASSAPAKASESADR